MSAVLLPHVAFAREVLDDPAADLSHPFLRRAQMAALPAVAPESLIEAPTFLMDLGLRRWRDPSILFDCSLEQNPKLKARWAQLSEEQEQQLVLQARAWETGEYSTQEICADLETLVMFTGDNQAGYHLAQLLATAVRPVDSCRLAIALGTMFSIEDPAGSLRMFKRAAELSRDDRAAFLIGLRQVALFVKRLHDYPAARDLIHQLHAAAWQSRVDFLVSDADASALEALLLNLRALIEVREDDLPGALRTMTEAAAVMPSDGFVIVPSDMADRYRAQVRINVVQVLWLSGHLSEALQRVNAHVMVTRGEHPYSLSEALLVAAYFNFLGHEYALALSYCMEAERLIALEGTPTRLALCRRVAVGSLAGIGKTRRAKLLAKQIPQDPLGDHRLV